MGSKRCVMGTMLVLICAFFAAAAPGAVRVPSVLGDHMLFQREMPIVI